MYSSKRSWSTSGGFAVFSALLILAAGSTRLSACSIFVLEDATRALFFNNEDWSNPNARVWFVPAGDGYFGCAYVGFDDGWGQGGVNTEGVAYDWVAGFSADWNFIPGLASARGNSSQRMLETCSTVDQAIAYYQTHFEAEFARARIMIADRTGASVIIGARAGKLVIERTQQCRGFGYGDEIIQKVLATPVEPTVARGLEILRSCRQEGTYATKYSNVYDLKSGDITIVDPARSQEVHLNFISELKKGAHYYNIPQLDQEVAEAPKPLLKEMKRFFLDEFSAIEDREPEITSKIEKVFRDALAGTLHSTDYTPELWSQLSPIQQKLEAEIGSFGDLISLRLVGLPLANEQKTYQYKIEFSRATVVQSFVFDSARRIAVMRSEGFEWKSPRPSK